MIRIPDWLPSPLGSYCLYFADHKGACIRLAWSDDLRGPWQVHKLGTLQLEYTCFLTEPADIPEENLSDLSERAFTLPPAEGVPSPLASSTMPYIASSDVHARDDRQQIVMYYHGLESFGTQPSRVAVSTDGIHFRAQLDLLARPYLRMFRHRSEWYGLAVPGVLYRSRDGLQDFEEGPTLFPDSMRNSAILKCGDQLHVFWSRVGDAPEHILHSTIDIAGHWLNWQPSDPQSVLTPQLPWEGADLPPEPSIRDAVNVRVNQLRDPAIYQEGDNAY